MDITPNHFYSSVFKINFMSLISFFSLLFSIPTLLFSINLKQKKPSNLFEGFRGIVRIRTGVGAFAEPSLATRPRRQFIYWIANIINY
jgi:hypothetical protein